MTKGIYIIQKIDRMTQLLVRNEHGGLMGALAIPIYGTQPPSAAAYVGLYFFINCGSLSIQMESDALALAKRIGCHDS